MAVSSGGTVISNQAKGTVFEKVVRKLLEKNEYEKYQPDNEQVDDCGRVRGRGEWHQIDALGRWRYVVPFVYPIRLLCEAKFLNGPADISVVRNFVGVVKDISENYFVEDNQDIDKRMLSKRHTDCGAVFSVNGFTSNAERYAYAQNIFLVSYENNPIIGAFKQVIEEVAQFLKISKKTNAKQFNKWFEEAWKRHHSDYYRSNLAKYLTDAGRFENSLELLQKKFEGVRTSVVGIASGIYPIHLLSLNDIPYELFRETDEQYFRPNYVRTETGGYFFELHPSDLPDLKFFFTIPQMILQKYRDSMRTFKREFLEWIDIPITIGRMRRILKLKLDTEWLRL
jgi:tetratricopeptide (TPR) repeat protein